MAGFLRFHCLSFLLLALLYVALAWRTIRAQFRVGDRETRVMAGALRPHVGLPGLGACVDEKYMYVGCNNAAKFSTTQIQV